jgi:hypothetical protein
MGSTFSKKWHVKPEDEIDLPPGTEFMAERGFAWIWYNPALNVSWHITGNGIVGYDIIQYPYAFCDLCRARREQYLYGD